MKTIKSLFLLLLMVLCSSTGCTSIDGIAEPLQFTVTFKTSDGQVLESVGIEEGCLVSSISAPETDAPFIGWCLKTGDYYSLYNFEAPVRQDLELYACYKDSRSHKVLYNFAKEGIENVTVWLPDQALPELLEFYTEDDEVVGWFADESYTQAYEPEPIRSDLELFARWRSMVPDEPEVDPTLMVLECESGELADGALIEEDASASAGKVVRMAEEGKGSISLQLNIPQEGLYKLVVTYKSTPSDKKPGDQIVNMLEIPRVTNGPQAVDFVKSETLSNKFIGMYRFKKGTAKIILSSAWGETVYDKVYLSLKENTSVFKAEFEDAVLSGNSVKENCPKPASGGMAVFMKDWGSGIDLKVVSPKKASYRMMIRYFAWAPGIKINTIEIPGHMDRKEVTFHCTNEYIEQDVGTISLDENEEFHIKLNASWGWTYYDCITFYEVAEPVVVEGEFEDGSYSSDCKVESPSDGASGGKTVAINGTGSGSLEITLPKPGKYKVSVRYFTWFSDDGVKMNKFGINGYLEMKDFDFHGTNSYNFVEVGTFQFDAGKVECVYGASWGWTFFDKVVFSEVVED